LDTPGKGHKYENSINFMEIVQKISWNSGGQNCYPKKRNLAIAAGHYVSLTPKFLTQKFFNTKFYLEI